MQDSSTYPVLLMFASRIAIRTALAAIAASLSLCSMTWSQQLLPPARQPANAPKAASTPARSAASCHNGASFDKFLAELKQRAIGEGVSQRAIEDAAPYLTYDQSIVNRDRGQRVFGQIFTEFAGRMAATYRMQSGQAHIKTYSAAFARASVRLGTSPTSRYRDLGARCARPAAADY